MSVFVRGNYLWIMCTGWVVIVMLVSLNFIKKNIFLALINRKCKANIKWSWYFYGGWFEIVHSLGYNNRKQYRLLGIQIQILQYLIFLCFTFFQKKNSDGRGYKVGFTRMKSIYFLRVKFISSCKRKNWEYQVLKTISFTCPGQALNESSPVFGHSN